MMAWDKESIHFWCCYVTKLRGDLSLLGYICWSTYFLLKNIWEWESNWHAKFHCFTSMSRLSFSPLCCLFCLFDFGWVGLLWLVWSEGVAVDVVLSLNCGFDMTAAASSKAALGKTKAWFTCTPELPVIAIWSGGEPSLVRALFGFINLASRSW